MSYILDALRRAEAERERGHVPSLHSQPKSPDDAATPARRLAPWLAAGGVALAAAAFTGWWLGTRPAELPATELAAAPPAPAMAPPGPPAGPPMRLPAEAGPGAHSETMTPPPLTGTEPPANEAQPMPEPAPAPRPTVRPPAVAPAPRVAAPVAVPASRPSRSRPAPPPAVQAPAAATPAAPAASVAPIIPFERLPPEVKRQLPTLALGGAVYSESAANRLLIVAGQLVHEGDAVAPGVMLEQIRPRSAVLRWKGLRYEVGF